MSPIEILLLEDNSIDADLVRSRLEREQIAFRLACVDNRDSFESTLSQRRFDLILADHSLPNYDGLSALDFARQHHPRVPFIFVSGTLGEELAVDTLKRGATDYVLKQRLDRLGPAIRKALAQSRELNHVVAALRTTEAALKESEDRLGLVLKAAELGLWYCDLPFDRLVWNSKVKEHFGLPANAEVTIDTFYERMHPDDRERTRAAIADSINNRAAYDIIYRTVGLDNRIRSIRAIGSAFYNGEGKPFRFDGITIDVTQLREAEQERAKLLTLAEEALADAEAANRMKDQFLATLSHELRTPLHAILGWATLLKTGKCDLKEQTEGLAAIERNAKVQAQLIDDLLDISRIVSGTLRLDLQQVSMCDVIEEALLSVTPAADAKSVRIVKVLDSLVPSVAGDPARLQQVVWNLLTNAVKFTPKGGRITVLLERVNSQLEVSVSDTGTGISPEFLPYVFDRFRQADNSSRRQYGGLGLGLSIVKQLVEMHGGQVRVKSPGLNQGATFTVMLPVAAVYRLPPSPTRSSASPRVAEVHEPEHAPDALAGVKILVVDDEVDARTVIERVLVSVGAQVQVAGSAQEALQATAAFRPQVLVSDVGMPGEDGYDLMRRLRSSGWSSSQLPAVALTAFARSDDRRRAMLAGFQTHVAKPVEPAELIAVVASLAGRTG